MALGLLAEFQDEQARLLRENDALVALSDTAKLDQAQIDRLGTIGERLTIVDQNVATLTAARERRREEPTTEAVAASLTSKSKPAQPFNSLGEQMIAIRNSTLATKRGGQADQRLLDIQATTGAVESVGADGGYLVQKDISDDLMSQIHETGVLQRRARRVNVGPNSNGVKINIIDETSRADGSRWGAIQAYWEPEATAATASRPKFKPLELTLSKLFALFYATDEQLMDAVQLSDVARTAVVEELGFKVDDAMIRGSGAGIPLGILNAPATVSVAKQTGQAAATIVTENVQNMYVRMPAKSLGNAEWFINQECWPQIFALSAVVGVGGVPLYVPAGGLSAAPFGTLLGRPVTPIEQAAALGTVGDINFVDFNQYLLIEKAGVQEDSSIHVEFLTDQQVFRWILRTNGQPRWAAAVTPFKGSNSYSPYVTLQTRS